MFRNDGDAGGACGCEPTFEADRLHLDARECPGSGRLAERPGCRETVVGALERRDAAAVVVRTAGVERRYAGDGAALLLAAGRFAARVGHLDGALVQRARRDPLGAATRAAGRGRTSPVARIAAETGLSACDTTDYRSLFAPVRRPAVADARLRRGPPPDARFLDRSDLQTGAVVRRYARPDGTRTYHLDPPAWRLDDDTLATLADAHERLARVAPPTSGRRLRTASVESRSASGERGGDRAARRAVAAVAGPEEPTELLAAVLEKHTGGLGVVADLLADSRVSDVFATTPVTENPLRVRVADETLETNVTLTEAGAAALASRFRLTSGRSLSRASPTLDATTRVAGRRVRVAAVTGPLSDGTGFAFRAHDPDPWRLADLVANGTLPPETAALLATAVARGAAVLVAGPRGAGKTTLLGALCWAVPERTRTLVVEDTPELPVGPLQRAGRDVQALRVASDDGPSVPVAEALRTALRLGDGALALGEVRDAEAASVLFDAMRVGAGDGAVLGTVHGEGAGAVRERVASEFGVAPTAFRATDCVVTLGRSGDERRLRAVEEVVPGDDGPAFEALYDGVPTGRVDRGQSRLLATLTGQDETYADVRAAVDRRRRAFEGEP
ncbi:ATPase, T2SS/T4P/T4SS family [Salinirubellus salinus]|uniref:ATPase, T2SS/T4P/T4SS family n=1 Tax=Salinirubellus salinus TaxID=1364945 RepID=A0A9E7R370_9EURY|nr:ATPase, T2SS/T4P/T4SS family [Salinirubellus salinus]UWM54950.1 ATPase, T2SS/T4P/T4SS family [Salinirubellus salinus]